MIKLFLFFCLTCNLVQAKTFKINKILVDDIVGVEYFWDEDPGIGKATLIAFTKATEVNTSLDIPTKNLSQGVHFLGIRLKTTLGQWSPTQSNAVYIHAPNPTGDPAVLSAVEYFFDEDLGFGKNTIQKISSKGGDAQIVVDLTVPSTLAGGTHVLGVRTQTERGQWTSTQLTPMAIFSNQPTSTINRVEFYILNDPGFGLANTMAFSPANGKEVDVDYILPLNFKGAGSTTFNFRARDSNGRWSSTYSVPMTITLVLANEEELKNSVSIYPNPSNGIFTIEFTEIKFSKDLEIEVVDLLGRSIYSQKVKPFNGKHYEALDISNNPNGQYFLRIIEADKNEVRKVVKGY
jgi:Secretion system C-terminal sorting domain